MADTEVEELCRAATDGDAAGLRAALAMLAGRSGALDTRNRRGLAALHCAAESGALTCIEELLGAGAAPDTKESDGGAASLHLAAQNSDGQAVRALLQGGASHCARDNDGWTPAHAAAYAGAEDVLAALLEAGADVEAAAACKRTPLHLAAAAGEAACLARLLASGASTGSTDGEGATPLHAAAAAGNLAAVRCLLEAGADVASRDRSGRTPAEAVPAGHAAAAELLAVLAPPRFQEQQQQSAGGDAGSEADGEPAQAAAGPGVVEQGPANSALGAELLGQAIAVWWNERRQWVAGQVVEYFAADRVHVVRFPAVAPSMQLQRMRLHHERLQLLGPGSKPVQQFRLGVEVATDWDGSEAELAGLVAALHT